MKKTDLRNGLHEIIDSIEDDHLLEAAYYLLKNHGHTTKNSLLSQEELDKSIRVAEEDIKLGRTHSHDAVKAYFEGKMTR